MLALCREKNISCTAMFVGEACWDEFDKKNRTQKYTVILRRKGAKPLSLPFFQGLGHLRAPTAADVVYCLCSDARCGEQAFEEFCSDLGYDSDSRRAELIWRKCRESAADIRAFLGDDFDAFANAEH